MTAAGESVPLEARRKYLGGSDIPALLGIAPATWRRNSPVALYYDKIEPPVEDSGNRREKSRGKKWEAVVGEMLLEELTARGYDAKMIRGNHRYRDPKVPYFAAEIDFELEIDGSPDPVNVEIKTVHPFKSREWGESDTDGAPDYVVAQLLWGLGVTDRRHGIIAPLFGADDLRVFPVERDESTLAGIRERAQHFWLEHVEKRIPPPPIYLEDMPRLFATDDGTGLVADTELTGKILRLRAIDAEIRARDCERQALEFDVKRAMGSAAELSVLDERGDRKTAVTWKMRPYTFLDETALKAEHPKIARKFTRKGGSRVFTVKQFAWR